MQPYQARCTSLMVWLFTSLSKHLFNFTNSDGVKLVRKVKRCITVSVKEDKLEKRGLSDFTLFFLSSWLKLFNGVDPNFPLLSPYYAGVGSRECHSHYVLVYEPQVSDGGGGPGV